MEKKKNLHDGHRSRVRARFIKEGSLDSFEYYQIVELLLFYAVAMKDTNELAHKLMDEYGSFHNLLNTKPLELMQRSRLTENQAVLLSLIPHVARRYLSSSLDFDGLVVNNLSVAISYMQSLLAGQPNELFYMLCLDDNKRLKSAVKISEGTSDRAVIYIDKVVGDALLHKSSFIILGHNHPNGTLNPSENDLNVTRKIVSAMEPIGIRVLDHLIICGDKYYSFARKNNCNLKYNV